MTSIGASLFASDVPKADSAHRTSGFDFSSLWTAPESKPEAPPKLPSPPPSTEPDSKNTLVGSDVVRRETDDRDFDMFLEEKEHGGKIRLHQRITFLITQQQS
jgi:hypothetical protein